MADPRYVHYESVQSSPDDDEDRMLKMYCASDYDALAARLAAVEAECTDLIAGKEYQAMQRTLAEVNARLAEVTRERDEAVARMEAGWIEVAEGPVSKVLRERLAEAERKHLTAARALVKAFDELNAIRARDGVPRDYTGMRTGVDEEYFSSVVDDVDAAVLALTGRGAHCHPLLYERATDSADASPYPHWKCPHCGWDNVDSVCFACKRPPDCDHLWSADDSDGVLLCLRCGHKEPK